MERLDKKAIEEHRQRVAEAVTKAVGLGRQPPAEQMHGTLKGLLSVAAVVYLRMRGGPVNRRSVTALAAAAADVMRQRLDADFADDENAAP